MASFNDGSIVAAPFEFEFPQYLTVDVANKYFCQRLNSDDWFSASFNDQNSSLIQATRAIDNLKFIGVKYDPNQPLEFPRWKPPARPCYPTHSYEFLEVPPYSPPVNNTQTPPGIPQDILIACCEIAIVLLGGFDFEQELAGLNNTSTVYSTVRETYDRNIVVAHIRHGIASGLAWTHLQPWLGDSQTFTISRVN